MYMKNLHKQEFRCQNLLPALLSLLAIWVLALPANVKAIEDPAGCSLANGGLGNSSGGGINPLPTQAHLLDTVALPTTEFITPGACSAINATGSIYIATGKLSDFFVNQNMTPGVVIGCPANPVCVAGANSIVLTAPLVGASVTLPNGEIKPGVPKGIKAVTYVVGTVQTGTTPEQLQDSHTATITVVTPCINVVLSCAYPGGANCFQAGVPISFTGYVTNCGDIALTNVTIVNSRGVQFLSALPPNLPLIQPIAFLNTNQVVSFKGSFVPTLADICGGIATNQFTVRGTDITLIGGPNASVTNVVTSSCNICVNPCLRVTRDCATTAIDLPQAVTVVVTNCGNIAITNISIADTAAGLITNNFSLAAGASASFTKTFTAAVCGPTSGTVTATGSTACGIALTPATATSNCTVTENPCIVVTSDCNEVVIGAANTLSGSVSNCGNVTLTNITVVDDIYGTVTSFVSLASGASQTYSRLVTNSCGSYSNNVTATGRSTCGTQVSATTNNTCAVTQNPCIGVSQSCDMALIGAPNVIAVVVTNCGNVAITGITVTNTAYGSVGTVVLLPAGGTVTITKSVTNTTCGINTSVVTASGTSACGTPVSASANNNCVVDCPPCIQVTKTVACLLPGTNCGTFGKIATGMKGDSQIPAFCYSITVSNCGLVTLTNVTVNDSQLGSLTNFPTSLISGGSVTRFYTKDWAVDTTNAVAVTGQSEVTGVSSSSSDSAVARVLQASLSCDMIVNPATIPGDGLDHPVTFTSVICNTSSNNLVLTNVRLSATACSTNIPSIPAGVCVTTECTVMLNCSNFANNLFTNTMLVTAQADTAGGICGFDITGTNVLVSNSGLGVRPCAAVVQCTNIPTDCALTVEKTACIVKKAIEDCEEEPVCIKIKYCGEDRDHESKVKVTCESGESRIYKLKKLHKGDVISCSEEHGFTFDASSHGKKKIGKKCRVDIDDEHEVFNTECDDKNREHGGMEIGRGMCLDESSPNNHTGSKGVISAKWSLVASVDPKRGLRTEDDKHKSNDNEGRGCDGHGGHDRDGNGHDDHDGEHCPNRTHHGCDGHGGHDNDGDGHDDHDDDHCQPPADICNNVLPPLVVKPGETNDCDGDIHEIHFGYEGGGCHNMHHSQSDRECKGETFSDKPYASPVRVRITDGAGSKVYFDSGSKASVHLNDIVSASAGYGTGNHFGSDTVISIYDDRGKLCSRVKFKSDDCKKLHLGDGFGGMKVCEMDSEHGGEHSLGVNVLYTYTIRNGDSNSCQVTGVSVVDDKLGTIATNLTVLGGQTIVLTNLVLVSDPITNIVVVSGVSCGGICSATGFAAIVRAAAPTNKECSEEIEGFLVEYTGEDRPAGTTITFIGDTGASVKYTFPTGLAKGTILSKASESDPDKGWTIDCKKHGRDKLGTKTHVRCNDREEEILHTGCTCREHNFIPGEPACLDESSPDNHEGHKGAASPMFKVVSFK